MNILKKWRKNNDGDTGLAKREGGNRGFLSPFGGGADQLFDRLWKDPWAALNQDLPALAEWPAVDIAEDDQAVTLRVDVPGLDEKDLDIEVSGNLLTIRGSREEEHSDRKHRRRERVSGSFVRTLTLPSYVDTAAIGARYDKGVLTLTAPKVPGKGPRRVTVAA